MSQPLVSVVIPAYNRAAVVGRAVESALAQTYPRLEIVVVDDGSTDDTLAALARFGDRIRIRRQANAGPSAARNRGARESSGEILAFLDSDDAWKPEKIERQVRMLAAGGPEIACCVCAAELIGEDGTRRSTFRISEVDNGSEEGYWLDPAPVVATRFLLFNQVVAVRRPAFESVGGFREELRILEDHDLAFRLALLGPWAYLKEPLVEKFEDQPGIGVQAMRDPLLHATAWRRVLRGFLDENLDAYPDVEALVRRALRDVETEVRAVERLRQGATFPRLAGRATLTMLRFKGAWRRRLPSWPRGRAVAMLPAPSAAMRLA